MDCIARAHTQPPSPTPGRGEEERGGRDGMEIRTMSTAPLPCPEDALLEACRRGLLPPEQLARFQTEAEAAARLRHPHIVPIYEIGQAEGRPYFSIEYVEGGSLAERLKDTVLPPREAARLLEALARAVQHAHQQGVVHR